MKQLQSFVASAALVSSVSTAVFAQPVSDFQQLEGALRQGQQVEVQDVSGRRSSGRIVLATPTELTIVRGGQQRSFTAGDVLTLRRHDSVANGALIGAGLGGGLAVLGFVSTRGRSDAVYGYAYIGSWLFPAVGGVVGWLIDRNSGREVIFQSQARGSGLSITPLLSPTFAGVTLVHRF